MNPMCAILEAMADWVNREPVPPLIYAALSGGRSSNSPIPYIGIAYQVAGEFDWWEVGGVRSRLPQNHLRVAWTHRGGRSSDPRGGESFWACAFDVTRTTVFDPFVNGPPIPTIPVRDGARLCRAYEDVALQFLMRRRTSKMRLKAALLNWLAVLLDEAHGKEAEGGASLLPAPVEKALEFMHRRIGVHELTLDEVAQASGLSVHHFGRVFLTAMRQSPIAYLRQVRIEHAKNLLRDTRLRVSEVAREAGFADPLHFSRVFHRVAGQSPRAFRRQA